MNGASLGCAMVWFKCVRGCSRTASPHSFSCSCPRHASPPLTPPPLCALHQPVFPPAPTHHTLTASLLPRPPPLQAVDDPCMQGSKGYQDCTARLDGKTQVSVCVSSHRVTSSPPTHPAAWRSRRLHALQPRATPPLLLRFVLPALPVAGNVAASQSTVAASQSNSGYPTCG